MKASDKEIAELVRQGKPLLSADPDRAARVKAAVLLRVAHGEMPPPPASAPRWRTPVIVAVALGLGLSGVIVTQYGSSPPATATIAPEVQGAASIPTTASPLPVAEAPATIDVASLQNVPAEAPPAKPSALPPPETPDPLEGEIRCLREARQALGRGDGDGALRALEKHAAEYPNGVLAEERRAMRVTALCSLGRVPDAKREARAFEETSPSSPHIGLLRQSCAHREED